MPSFSSTKSSAPPIVKASEAEPVFHKKEIKVEFTDLEDEQGGGFTIGLAGMAGTGKSTSAQTLLYLQKQYIPDLQKAGFVEIPKALEEGTIPEVKKCIMIDSELAATKQKNRPIEDAIIPKEMRKLIKKYTIPPVNTETIANIESGISLTQESIDKVSESSQMYSAAIEKAFSIADQNTLFIMDSASRFKILLDINADINNQLKNIGASDARVQDNSYNKWTGRNVQWQRTLTLCRGMPGWVMLTFMDEENSDQVKEMQKKKTGTSKETKRLWAPRTEFNFDMIYAFKQENPHAPRIVEVDFARYLYDGIDKAKYDGIELNGRFSFLWAIEGMLRGMREKAEQIKSA